MRVGSPNRTYYFRKPEAADLNQLVQLSTKQLKARPDSKFSFNLSLPPPLSPPLSLPSLFCFCTFCAYFPFDLPWDSAAVEVF